MTAACEPLVLGIDLGTGGVRAVVVTGEGTPVAQSAVRLAASDQPAAGASEQSPAEWWRAVCVGLAAVVPQLHAAGRSVRALRGVSVDGTSGTLVAVDEGGNPVRPAIMYNDSRSTAEADELTHLAQAWCGAAGYRIESSFSLAKMLWMARREPQLFRSAARFLHQADYVAGRLTGEWTVTDYGNALKSCYDLREDRWPSWIDELPGLAERLPAVVAPGTVIGRVSASAAGETGLPAGLAVIAGTTDGVASAVASGLRIEGDYNTTLGTTLVFKGLSTNVVRHPQGLVYSHKLPGGCWLPGAASNTGAAWIGAWFPDARPQDLDRAAAAFLPARAGVYPLVGRGERFPFRCPEASRFAVPEPVQGAHEYAACLAGTALVERLAYEVLDATCGTTGGAVYSTGGGSKSDLWMQCRADVTGRTLHRPGVAESAFGSAILAAAGTLYESLARAIQAMCHIERTFVPADSNLGIYDELYGMFRAELARRGYLD